MSWKNFTEQERNEIRSSIVVIGRTETAERFGISRNRTYTIMSIPDLQKEKEKVNLFKNMCVVCSGKRKYRLFCKLHHYRYVVDPRKEKRARKIAIMEKYGLK